MNRPTFLRPTRWGPGRRLLNALLLMSLALGSVTAPEAWAFDLYVATTGSDAGPNDCRTSGTPCRTLTHALTQASGTTSDVVNVAAGTYNAAGGEAFPLALVDGVVILGDTATPATRTISAPYNQAIFFNDDASDLGTATRLAGFTLTHDADPGFTDPSFLEFAVGDGAMAPMIDHNVFAGRSGFDTGVFVYDDSSADGSFTGTLDNNTFTSISEGVQILQTWYGGLGDTYSPTITNNTFTNCQARISYTLSSNAEGTVGGTVSNNATSGTGWDVYVSFRPDGSRGVSFRPTISNNTFSVNGGDNIYIDAVVSGFSGNLELSPTITNNSMSTLSGTNINVTEMSAWSGTGNVTFAPQILDNPTMTATDYNFYLWQSSGSIDGDITIAPTVNGNTMTGANDDAIFMSLSYASVSTANQQVEFSPTVVGNTITAPGRDGMTLSVSEVVGRFVSDMTISNNTITSPGNDGIEIWALSMGGVTALDWTVAIANNTVTNAGQDGIAFYPQTMSYSGSGTIDVTLEGNVVDTTGAYGIVARPAYALYDTNSTAVTALIRGNTVTDTTSDGIHVYFSGLTSGTLDARITDNVVQSSGRDGLQLYSEDLGSNGILVSCNTFTGNGRHGIFQGTSSSSSYDPPADFGGGNLSSPGNNVLLGNTGSDLYNAQPNQPASAQHNWWGDSDPSDQVAGPVDFSSPLSGAPNAALTPSLVDTVVVDVAPPGASIGDTIEYTATITPAADACGDTDVVFTVAIPANATLVSGSVTTSKGEVTGTDPIVVDIGRVSSVETVVVTWRVVADSGTELASQGSVTAATSGTTPSDDPDTAPAADPTVTLFEQQQGGEAIPTLGQYALLLLAGLLLLLGTALLRRRHFSAASLAIALALGSGLAGAAPSKKAEGGEGREKVLSASVLEATTSTDSSVTLTLADGTSVTVPRGALKVRDLRDRPARPDLSDLDAANRLIERTKLRLERKAERAQQRAAIEAMTPEQRDQLQEQRRLQRLEEKFATATMRRDPLAQLGAGTPVVVRVTRDRDGSVKKVLVEVYASEERARAEAERFTNRRQSTEARRDRN